MALCLFRRPLTDEEKRVQIVFLWTRVYVLFSVNQIIGRELVPFEKWYQEAIKSVCKVFKHLILKIMMDEKIAKLKSYSIYYMYVNLRKIIIEHLK